MLTYLIGWCAVVVLTVSSAGSPLLALTLAVGLLLDQFLTSRRA